MGTVLLRRDDYKLKYLILYLVNVHLLFICSGRTNNELLSIFQLMNAIIEFKYFSFGFKLYAG